MSGLLDYHVDHALKQGWPRLRDNFADFKALFSNVADSVLTEWWNALRAKPPTFAVYSPAGPEGQPLVITELRGETKINEPLGRTGYVDEDTDREVAQIQVEQTVTCTIWATTPEIVRALQRVVIGLLSLAEHAFVEAGYDDLTYQGADALTMDEQLLAEKLGAVVRPLRFTASSVVDIPHAETLTTHGWFVLAGDLQTLAGQQGGVIPFEPDP